MTGRRLQRRGWAAWLGLLALAVQVLLPALASFEMTLAADGGDDSIFALCIYGHIHEAAPPDHDHSGHDPPGHRSDHRHGGLGDACPLCIALHAQGAFTTPAPAPLPLPSLAGEARPPVLTGTARHTPRVVAYRSRAPPLA